MADWSTIATISSTDNGPSGSFSFASSIFATLWCGTEYELVGSKDTTDGYPSQPSLRMDRRGVFQFRWTVPSGSRSISISVKQADNVSPRPTLVVKANTDIGVNADVTATAPSGTGWVTCGPATISPSSLGAVLVELRNNYEASGSTCFWDNVTIS